MIKLIIYEIKKIYLRPFAKLLLVLILISTLLFGWFLILKDSRFVEKNYDNWENKIQSEADYCKRIVATEKGLKKKDIVKLNMKINFYDFVLKEKIAPYDWRWMVYSGAYYEKTMGMAFKTIPKDLVQQYDEEINIVLRNDYKSYYDIKLRSEVGAKDVYDISKRGFEFFKKNNIVPNENNWRYKLGMQNINFERALLSASKTTFPDDPDYLSDAKKNETSSQIKINEYRIINNLPVAEKETFFWFFGQSKSINLILMLIMILIVAACFCGEFSTRNINNLLTLPYKRKEVLFSKIMANGIVGLIISMGFYISVIITGLLLFKIQGDYTQYVFILQNNVYAINYFLYLALICLFGLIENLIWLCPIIMLSVLSKNSAVTVGVGLFAYLLAKYFLLSQDIFKIDGIFKYILPTNSDWTKFIDGSSPFTLETVGITLGVCILNCAVALMITNYRFSKMDV